ncbi:hypothetical protein, partial [Clostridium sp.]|uniref:hypothetical protein n=1 Tax=Clostridium sp. TaxID=1506 RepID=UPI0026266068
MNRKSLSILIASTVISCGIGGIISNAENVKAIESPVYHNQNDDSKVDDKNIVENTAEILKETRKIYFQYKYKLDKNFLKEIKEPVEYIYMHEDKMKKLEN